MKKSLKKTFEKVVTEVNNKPVLLVQVELNKTHLQNYRKN